MKKIQSIASLCLAVLMFATSCKKEEGVGTIPAESAHFGLKSGGTYIVENDPNSRYVIPVGTTTVSNKDRIVTISVTSPTNAVEGTHYSFVKRNVKIAAGNALDSIVLKATYSQYTSGRRDTLIFKISEPDVKGLEISSTFTLVIRACFESDIATGVEELLGDYTNTNEVFGTSAYGPYTTTVTSAQITGPTSAEVAVQNVFGTGWSPIKFTLDWSGTPITTVGYQTGFGDAGDLNPAYAGYPAQVRAFSGQFGTFSYCNQTMQFKMQLGVTGLGYFGSLYTVNLAR